MVPRMEGSAAARRARITFLVAAALVLLVLACAWPAAAGAQGATPAEVALAEAYAPVVMLKEQAEACDSGEPYEPIDIDLLLDNDEIALRGPWDTTNIVDVAPSGATLGRGLRGYHLDFPGHTLDPGCDFAEWSARLIEKGPSTTYARVVTQDDAPGKLALQYWFFYVFNDWNNNHEGDWEMIQIVFDADTPAQALRVGPTEVGYSQHSSAERARWGDDKLEIVGGTHPVVYPAAGSHANFFTPHVFLMRSQAEGMGCDDASGPSRSVRPVVATVPTDRDAYLAEYPWLGFDGRWGEQHSGVFNGPTGPNDKTQWTQPITWSQESWRDASFAVPGGGAVGTMATDMFCGSVAAGSEALRVAKSRPAVTALVVGGLAVLLVWALTRTRWRPDRPDRIPRRRAWGQLLTDSFRIFGRHPRLFLGIGLAFIPVGLLITLVQYLLFHLTRLELLVDEAGGTNPVVATFALALGLLFTLLGLAAVQAAVAWALGRIDEGGRPGVLESYREVWRRRRLLVPALAVAVAVQAVFNISLILVPIAVFVLVRWSLLAVVVGTEGAAKPGVLRRAAALARGDWWRVATVAIGVTGAALLVGPVVGVLALIATGAAFNVINLIAAVVYVVALPISAITMTLLYHDLRLRRAEEAERAAAADAGPHDAAPGAGRI